MPTLMTVSDEQPSGEGRPRRSSRRESSRTKETVSVLESVTNAAPATTAESVTKVPKKAKEITPAPSSSTKKKIAGKAKPKGQLTLGAFFVAKTSCQQQSSSTKSAVSKCDAASVTKKAIPNAEATEPDSARREALRQIVLGKMRTSKPDDKSVPNSPQTNDGHLTPKSASSPVQLDSKFRNEATSGSKKAAEDDADQEHKQAPKSPSPGSASCDLIDTPESLKGKESDEAPTYPIPTDKVRGDDSTRLDEASPVPEGYVRSPAKTPSSDSKKDTPQDTTEKDEMPRDDSARQEASPILEVCVRRSPRKRRPPQPIFEVTAKSETPKKNSKKKKSQKKKSNEKAKKNTKKKDENNQEAVSVGGDDTKSEPDPLASEATAASGDDAKIATTEMEQTGDSGKVEKAPELTADEQALLHKHSNMRDTYAPRGEALLKQCRDGVAEEKELSIPVPDTATLPTGSETDEPFPDAAVGVLSSLIEGRSDSLSNLAASVTDSLNRIYSTSSFSLDSTSTKMKLIASRKNYVKVPPTADVFEDESTEAMWRWEVALLDVLPAEVIFKAKKARTARKKLSSHYSAISKLIGSLDQADSMINEGNSDKEKLGKLLARISQEEERVLRYEREEEKARLAAEAKAKKEAEKAAAIKRKMEEKLALAEKKKLELAKKKEDEARKKEELAQERARKKEEAELEKVRKKEEAAREAAKKEEQERQASEKKKLELTKQKARMMSFFSRHSSDDKSKDDHAEDGYTITPSEKLIDTDSFRSAINAGNDKSSPLFSSLSSTARKSRRRRTKRVPVSVFVTVYPDDPFAVQPFAEQKEVIVLNKQKFFLFHEDVRPPYYGTWSKESSVISGKNPFAKDSSFLDYEVDSEAEWEEGDDEVGEDVECDAGDDDEEQEEEGDDNEDGWLAADDEIDEDLDEETKLVRKQQQISGGRHVCDELKLCYVAPAGGTPLVSGANEDRVTGFTFEQGINLLDSLEVVVLNDSPVALDAFPPSTDDREADPNRSSPGPDKSNTAREMTDDEMRTFVQFVHRCTLPSKDRVVDELRQKHENVTSSRAQALRVLDMVADKKKHPTNGIYWEVKEEVLERLGLKDLISAKIDEVGERKEALKTAAMFVHHNLVNSKEKLVDELRMKHDSVSASRAEGIRLVDAIAEKKKHPQGGVYWEVKEEVLENIGLQDLPSTPPKLPTTATDEPAKEKKTPSGSAKKAGSSKRKPKASGGKDSASKASASKKKKKKIAPTKISDAGENVVNAPSASKEAPGSAKKRKGSPTSSQNVAMSLSSAGLLATFLKKQDTQGKKQA